MENIDKVIYINLDDRKDRRFWCENQLQNFPFKNVERKSAIRHRRGQTGCALSHISVLENLIHEPGEMFLILEDDFFFTRSPQEIDYYMHLLPKYDWQVFCLSFTFYQIQEYLADGLTKIKKCHSAGAYLVKKSFVPILLDNFKHGLKNGVEIDISWQLLQKNFLFLGTEFPLVIQNISYSNIEKRIKYYQPFSFVQIHLQGNLGDQLFQLTMGLALSLKYHKILFLKGKNYFTIPTRSIDPTKIEKIHSNSFLEMNLLPEKSYLLENIFPNNFSYLHNLNLDCVQGFLKNPGRSHLIKKNNDEIIYICIYESGLLKESDYYSTSKEWFKNHFTAGRCKFIIFTKKNDDGGGIFSDSIILKNLSQEDILCTMKACDHHILSSSSLGFWGALLNTNPNKIVLYPENKKDYYYPASASWIPIKSFPKNPSITTIPPKPVSQNYFFIIFILLFGVLVFLLLLLIRR